MKDNQIVYYKRDYQSNKVRCLHTIIVYCRNEAKEKILKSIEKHLQILFKTKIVGQNKPNNREKAVFKPW